jgi:hypothetical protein
MVNYAENPRLSAIIYQNGDKLIYCTVHEGPKGETPLGSFGPIMSDPLLHGPIGQYLATTQGVEGEYMAIGGQVSARVGRVVFDDGAGHTREAHVANGTYAIAGGYGKLDEALLISYDKAGKEIDRRRAFGFSCDPHYTGAHGNIPGTMCEPTERWTPQAIPQQPRN